MSHASHKKIVPLSRRRYFLYISLILIGLTASAAELICMTNLWRWEDNPYGHAIKLIMVAVCLIALLIAIIALLFEGKRIKVQGIHSDGAEGLLLHYLMELSPNPIHIMDLKDKGKMLFVNDAACDHFGYPREALLTMRIPDWDPDVSQEGHARLSEELRREKKLVFETSHRRSDGTVVPVEITTYHLPYGDMELSVGQIRNITKRKQEEEETRFLSSLVEFSTTPIFALDMDDGFKMTFVNRAACEHYGMSREEVLNMHLPDWDPIFTQEKLAALKDFVMNNQRTFIETQHRRKDGSIVPVEIVGNHMVYQHRNISAGYIRDISERKQSENKLQLAASVFSHSFEGIAITTSSGKTIDVNDAFMRITGYTREEVLGQDLRFLQSSPHPQEFYDAMLQELRSNGNWSGEIWNRHKNGEVYAVLVTVSAVRDEKGSIRNFVALFTDITHLKKHERQLRRMAKYDALTGLPNRTLLADRLHQAMAHSLRRKHSLAVAYIDLDGFKIVNDKHGHHIGDELLIALANRMKAVLREVDTLARLGGDEFVAVMVDLNEPHDCEAILARLLEAASAPVTIDDTTISVSASIGVAFYPEDNQEAALLIQHADLAMYRAKQAGKNRFHLFSPNMDAQQSVPSSVK